MDTKPSSELLRLLLAASCQRALVDHSLTTECAPLSPGLLRLSRYHGLDYGLLNFDFSNDTRRTSVNRRVQIQLLQAEAHRHQCLALAKVLVDESISHVFIKGSALVWQFYPNFGFARNASDIDILVESDDVAQVAKLLLGLGYRFRRGGSAKHADFVSRFSSWYRYRDLGFEHSSAHYFDIDLHWRIADVFTLPIATTRLLAERELLDVGDTCIAVPNFDQHLVYIAIHARIDMFFRAKQWLDIYAASQHPRFSLHRLLKVAAEFGVERQVSEVFDSVNWVAQTSLEMPAYADSVWRRYEYYGYLPPRSHPNQHNWTKSDKRAYLRHQLDMRSDGASALGPLLARFKYDREMVREWPRIHPLLWYPIGFVKRLWHWLNS